MADDAVDVAIGLSVDSICDLVPTPTPLFLELIDVKTIPSVPRRLNVSHADTVVHS